MSFIKYTSPGRIVSGEEAVAIGLATRTAAEPRAAALELAREIADKSPDAVRNGKKLLNAAWVLSPADGLALEAELQTAVLGKPNQLEAIAANMEKRPARFRDPG